MNEIKHKFYVACEQDVPLKVFKEKIVFLRYVMMGGTNLYSHLYLIRNLTVVIMAIHFQKQLT